MIPMPGPTPLRGDALTVLVSGTRCTVTGEVSLRGVLRGGRGYAELTLPSGLDPQQRRSLEQAARKEGALMHWLYRDGSLIDECTGLTARGTHRTDDGALVLSGSP